MRCNLCKVYGYLSTQRDKSKTFSFVPFLEHFWNSQLLLLCVWFIRLNIRMALIICYAGAVGLT